jgi:hypothetical protein
VRTGSSCATLTARGRSSVGRASASQAEGRGFDPRRPLWVCGASRGVVLPGCYRSSSVSAAKAWALASRTTWTYAAVGAVRSIWSSGPSVHTPIRDSCCANRALLSPDEPSLLCLLSRGLGREAPLGSAAVMWLQEYGSRALGRQKLRSGLERAAAGLPVVPSSYCWRCDVKSVGSPCSLSQCCCRSRLLLARSGKERRRLRAHLQRPPRRLARLGERSFERAR